MTDLDAPITEVTVYTDRALVSRIGSLPLAAGIHEVRIGNLPTLVPDSLRASGQGPQGTRILDVDLTTTFHHRPPEAELEALQDACDQVRHQIALLRLRQNALKNRQQWLCSLGEQTRDFARGLAQGNIQAQEYLTLLTLTSQHAQHDAEDELDLVNEEKRLRRELAARERELAARQGNRGTDRWAAVVTVEMAQEGALTLEISYLVTQASWRPLYDVRVNVEEDGNQGNVELIYHALVQQATGEDWKQVHLTLSTARPSQAARLPELHPRYLHASTLPTGGAHNNRVADRRSYLQDIVSSTSTELEAQEADGRLLLSEKAREQDQPIVPEQAEIATAHTEQKGAICTFVVQRAVDIPSDNTPHKTTIAHDDLPCTFDYVSAPALDPVVHQRATITNTTRNALLPGPSSIFLRGDYVGTTQIQLTAPREEFQLFLGIDDTIKVKYELLERTVEKGALLQGGMRRISYAYQITLTNYAPFARQIVLRDQFPVSQHERVKVKVLSVQPSPSERTKLELLNWSFSLAANGSSQVDYRYTVEYPQDLLISGLS